MRLKKIVALPTRNSTTGSGLNTYFRLLLKIMILFRLVQYLSAASLQSDEKFKSQFKGIQDRTFGDRVTNAAGTMDINGVLNCGKKSCDVVIHRFDHKHFYANKQIDQFSVTVEMAPAPWRLTVEGKKMTLLLPSQNRKSSGDLNPYLTLQYGEFDVHVPRRGNALYTDEMALDQYTPEFRNQFVDDVLRLHQEYRIVMVAESHNRVNAPEITSLLFAIATDHKSPRLTLFSEANFPTKGVKYLETATSIVGLESGFEHVFQTFPPDRQTIAMGKQIYARVINDYPDIAIPASKTALKTPTKENILLAIDELIHLRSAIWLKTIQLYLRDNPDMGIIVHCGASHIHALQEGLAAFERWRGDKEQVSSADELAQNTAPRGKGFNIEPAFLQRLDERVTTLSEWQRETTGIASENVFSNDLGMRSGTLVDQYPNWCTVDVRFKSESSVISVTRRVEDPSSDPEIKTLRFPPHSVQSIEMEGCTVVLYGDSQKAMPPGFELRPSRAVPVTFPVFQNIIKTSEYLPIQATATDYLTELHHTIQDLFKSYNVVFLSDNHRFLPANRVHAFLSLYAGDNNVTVFFENTEFLSESTTQIRCFECGNRSNGQGITTEPLHHLQLLFSSKGDPKKIKKNYEQALKKYGELPILKKIANFFKGIQHQTPDSLTQIHIGLKEARSRLWATQFLSWQSENPGKKAILFLGASHVPDMVTELGDSIIARPVRDEL